MTTALPIKPLQPAALIRPERCEKCKWASALRKQENFECRRNPPVPAHVPRQMRDGSVQFMTYSGYPQVRPDQWCGEFSQHIEGN